MSFIDFKMALRGMMRNRLITVINIVGLAIGITISLYVFSYVRFEKSIDKFIPEYQNIYNLNNFEKPSVSQKMINLVKQNFPEIEDVTYFTGDWSPQVFLKQEDHTYKIDKMLTADSCFFRVFQFATKWGDAKQALNSANKIVITESLSKKIFGSENPVGKSLVYNSTYLDGENIEVGAVIFDLPPNTSWDFEAILSLQTNYKIGWYVRNTQAWGTCNYKSFFRVNSHISGDLINKKLASLPASLLPEDQRKNIKFSAIPFSSLYFEHTEIGLLKHGDKQTLMLVQVIGLLIMVLACINYFNLISAQSEKRFFKVGIIKTMGSTRGKVIQFFVVESFLSLFFAILLTIGLVSLTQDISSDITKINFSFSDLFFGENGFIIGLIIILMLIGTGLMPGLFFSQNKITHLLQKNKGSSEKNWLRNGLLVFQFVVSIALISSVIFIQKQNNYLQNQDLGFQKENIVIATINENIQDRFDYFKSEIAKIPQIKGITFSSSPITDVDQNWGRQLTYKGKEQQVYFSMLHVSKNFFNFFGIKLLSGKPFTDNSTKSVHYIFNKKAIDDFNISDIKDARITYKDVSKGQIIGVVNNFNYKSLHFPVQASGFQCTPTNCDFVYIKLNELTVAQFDRLVSALGKIWNDISPKFPLEYEFLDKKIEAHYIKERQFQKVLKYTTIISLMISCLGLIGLSFFIMEQRTKEIGVRKINGAKTFEIVKMLNRDFLKWVAIAFTIACPIAYYAIDKWLENFAYKTELSWWVFALAGLIAMCIALLTVSIQSWRAATRNPVESLRYE